MPSPATTDVQERVTALVTRVILECSGRAVALSPADDLIQLGYLDSLSVGQLLRAIEDEWRIEIELTELSEATIGSVAAITRLVAEHTAGR